MAENVQCPVCTLYLHAGMSLSDHLETHPKEQVIKALVQMTISGVGGSTSTLASVLKSASSDGAESKKSSNDCEEASLANEKILSNENTETNIMSSNSCNVQCNVSNSGSNNSISDQSTKSSQNSNSIINFPSTHMTGKSSTEVLPASTQILKSEDTPTVNKEQGNKDNPNATFSNNHRSYPSSSNEISNVETNFGIFGNQRYLHHRNAVNQQQQMPPPPAPQAQQHDLPRSILPPPVSVPQNLASHNVHSSYHTLQAQHLLPQPHPGSHLANVSHRPGQQTQIYSSQHQQPPQQTLHQQDMKVIYSPGLPPPPPLQLFSYQTHSQIQHHHQKPPPTYGTAISQIRSQNKNHLSGQFAAQHQNSTMSHQDVLIHHQPHIQQQPAHSQQHSVRAHGTPQPSPSTAAKHLFSKTNDLHHQSLQPVHHANLRQSNAHQHQDKFFIAQQEHGVTDVGNSSQYNTLTANDTHNKISKGTTSASSASVTTHSTTAQVSISPAVASASMAVVAASTLSRHTNSPFAALLAAAAGAPSPSNTSSVLRYAESPVAHYLERDNGDFIVQETPKHIVECVEKDNGEFSVIERIYQSPPSVLHIHDDADDDDDDAVDTDDETIVDNNADYTEGDDRNTKAKCDGQNKVNIKKRITTAMSSKEDVTRNSKQMLVEANGRKNGRKAKNIEKSPGSGVADFVSILSDSDEEEFISQDKQQNKNMSEKSIKNDTHLLPTTSTSSVHRTQNSTPMVTDAPSSSNSISSNNSSLHQNVTRKKSSKNTITVLSDVQLNLNEYLDLVGNIIASSKVAAQRRTFTSIAPIPLVKIEKEEPMDEYAPDDTADQQLPPIPLKANKQETEELTDNPSSSSNKSNNIRLAEQTHQERDEKKPQVVENVTENTNVSSLFNKNSSQVTSVIRMATTSQHTLQQQLQHDQVEKNSDENIDQCSILRSNDDSKKDEAEDLSQNVRSNTSQCKALGHATLGRKGPKKLIIKPKISKNDRPISVHLNVNDQQPSTSAKALEEYSKIKRSDDALVEVKVKNEPITSITFENNQCHSQPSYSILEQHLNSKEPLMVCKEEKPCIQENSLTTAIKEMKVENNVNDDARVLYDFATSKNSNTNNKTSTFPSATSVFAKNSRTTVVNEIDIVNERKNLESENETSSYSFQSGIDSINLSETEANNPSGQVPPSSEHNGNSQIISDFPFNYMYNNNVSEQANVKISQQLSNSFYQNSTAPSQSSNNTLVLEDSSSSKNYSDYNQQHRILTSSQNQWTTSYSTASEDNVPSQTSNSNLYAQMSPECGRVLDSSEVGKYLDLDACKREKNIDIAGNAVSIRESTPPPPPSSSTSCSFTDNSMVGICSTAGTLNIRTDEKMPAKGEISEQESNCDIDNSWSQPIYGDISARFFKTNFPAIFQQENGWNHEEYFTVQDLSASATCHTTNTNNKTKSFDFRVASADNSDIVATSSTSNGLFAHNSNDNCNIDTMPSTSAKLKKRRKHGSLDGKTLTIGLKREQPTSTITSQQVMQSQDYNFSQHEQQPSTSSAFLAGPSSAQMIEQMTTSTISSQQSQPQKIRTKVYECGHCNTKYSKLKDRNAHMVDAHNYVRQNRRLVCLTNQVAIPMNDVVPATTTSGGCNGFLPPSDNDGSVVDFKQGIVKIENENIHRDDYDYEQIRADLKAKTEVLEDDKKHLSLVQITSSTSEMNSAPKQSTFKPLSLTTTTSKLTTLYRMLVTFNLTTLKQSQRMSEFDESHIKSSIFFCYVCKHNFNSVKLYDAHLTEHPAECFTCGKKFQRWKNFSLHLKRHLGWKEFGCTVCEKKFVVRSALVEHMRMHSGLSPLKCKICGKHFKRYSNLTQHRKRHTKQVIRRKEYVCYCGEVLPSKARFLWHKETHDSKPKCCPHCCDRFVHVNSLRRHIRLAHSEKFDYAEPMECPICKQIFAKASMKAHMATHSTDTQYDCAICNKSFSTKWNLKIHSWVHANRTAKPFKCEHCPKAFVREVDFKNHMNSHKQIKPYTCEVCGCKFIRKYNYMRHRREHHGNKKYTCDLCKKSFHRHYYLIEHKRIHTGERPFQCTICGKSSTTKTNHNKHLKIHHSRDPFTVEV
ncbi:uncharacterized protein LOC142221465 [Haematobia irritans]|uniref:uncharacterized protein LOC142221465 n=1 Tax=Haematobia irritans TaxID=7368 RepID=UPI003F503947